LQGEHKYTAFCLIFLHDSVDIYSLLVQLS